MVSIHTLERTQINTRDEFYSRLNEYEFDFSDVKGQENIYLIDCIYCI